MPKIPPPPPPSASPTSTPKSPTPLIASVKKPPTLPRGIPSTTKKVVRVPKTFAVEDWSGDNEGEKVILHAPSGMGKTTLAAMAPKPVFIGIDDGGRKIKHPVTGEDLRYIPGIETFDDYRDALHQKSLFDNDETVVTDTATVLQDLGLTWTLENVKTEGKEGKFPSRIEDYGWGKGHRHLYDTMHLILGDLDNVVRNGKNIILICQTQQTLVANAEGVDYLKDVPKLANQFGKVCPSVWGTYCEWADHVIHIRLDSVVAKEKKAVGGRNRVIYVHPEVYFEAKSRTIPIEYPKFTFNEPSDDSVWQYLFDRVWENSDDS